MFSSFDLYGYLEIKGGLEKQYPFFYNGILKYLLYFYF